MRIVGLLILGIFAYTSYFYWLKYPIVLDEIFRLKDDRIKRKLAKIWFLNINGRAFAIHKLMKKKHNRVYIENGNSLLLKNYLRSKKYWYWSLVPLIVLIVLSQIDQGYEMFFEREQFLEKINDSWFSNILKNGD